MIHYVLKLYFHSGLVNVNHSFSCVFAGFTMSRVKSGFHSRGVLCSAAPWTTFHSSGVCLLNLHTSLLLWS